MIIYLSIIILPIVLIFSYLLTTYVNLNSNLRSRCRIFFFSVALALRKANFVSRILALNKTALCGTASLAFSFVLGLESLLNFR